MNCEHKRHTCMRLPRAPYGTCATIAQASRKTRGSPEQTLRTRTCSCEAFAVHSHGMCNSHTNTNKTHAETCRSGKASQAVRASQAGKAGQARQASEVRLQSKQTVRVQSECKVATNISVTRKRILLTLNSSERFGITFIDYLGAEAQKTLETQ